MRRKNIYNELRIIPVLLHENTNEEEHKLYIEQIRQTVYGAFRIPNKLMEKRRDG